jgi:uroporphyrinogen-III decarboxylase
VHIPREWLRIDRDAINRDCAETDGFTMAGISANPFERLQFIRGPEALYMDLADPPPAMQRFLRELHGFFCDHLSVWAKTDVDSLMIGDDWGSQRSLLVSPTLWRNMFKPLYRDYIQIAHNAGKKLFLHSDGHIAAIFPDFIELEVDAVNSQIFCMGVEALRPFAGRITFWGEMDRQHLLPHGTVEDIDSAVRSVHDALWDNGGCIAQCEFTTGSQPENVRQVFASWDAITRVDD